MRFEIRSGSERYVAVGPAAGTIPGGPERAAAGSEAPAAALPFERGIGCRWVLGDPRQRGWRYCDAPRVSVGCAYCAEHRARAYVRVAAVEEVG